MPARDLCFQLIDRPSLRFQLHELSELRSAMFVKDVGRKMDWTEMRLQARNKQNDKAVTELLKVEASKASGLGGHNGSE